MKPTMYTVRCDGKFTKMHTRPILFHLAANTKDIKVMEPLSLSHYWFHQIEISGVLVDLISRMEILEKWCNLRSPEGDIILTLTYESGNFQKRLMKLVEARKQQRTTVKAEAAPQQHPRVGNTIVDTPHPLVDKPQEPTPPTPTETSFENKHLKSLEDRLEDTRKRLFEKDEKLANTIGKAFKILSKVVNINSNAVAGVVDYCDYMLDKMEKEPTNSYIFPKELITELDKYINSPDCKKPQQLLQIYSRYISKEMVSKWNKTMVGRGDVFFKVESRVAIFEDFVQYLLEFKPYVLNTNTLTFEERFFIGYIFPIWDFNINHEFPASVIACFNPDSL